MKTPPSNITLHLLHFPPLNLHPFSFTLNKLLVFCKTHLKFNLNLTISTLFITSISLFAPCLGGNSMPTPVTTAKQCLNPQASHALDEAVSLTRRRGHPQTTSLHAVSAFLSLSPSQLREACIRARNAAFYPRVQLKALDFCLSVSLDRLPTSQPRVDDEPTISNSLMAAIKRSQANQRRQPDCILTVKNQSPHDQLVTPSSAIKVELQHLIVSILDDPIVSRVFHDAGFRSFDVKMAILRPFHNFFSYPSRYKGYLDPGYRPFRFPFSDPVEDYKRIGEVLVRKQGRNPLLVGSGANDALKGFMEVLEKNKDLSFLPLELRGINVVSIEADVFKCVSENWSDEVISLRLKGVDLLAQHCLGPGLMVSFGTLSTFLGDENGFVMDSLNSLVRKLIQLLEVHGSRVWVIGSAANDQTYMEFLTKFPSIDKDWDLQLMPITSVKTWIGDSCFKSSLSFVPLGGFFSSPSDMKFPFSSSCQYVTRPSLSSEKLEHEVSVFSKGGFIAPTADQNQTALSPWMQMAKLGVNNTLENVKANGGTMLQTATAVGFQRKWDNVGQHLHSNQSSLKPEMCRDHEEKLLNVNSQSRCTADSSCEECDNIKTKSCISMNVPNHSKCEPRNPILLRSLKDENFLDKLAEGPSKTKNPLPDVDDSQTSPSSGVSVVADLGLELFSQPCKQQRTENDDWVRFTGDSDANNFKTLFKALFERLGRQCQAVRIISQIVAHAWTSDSKHQTSALRGDIWLNFTGPDVFGQRKIALSLAEVLYGNRNSLIHVDLSSIDRVFHHKGGCSLQIFSSDVRFRGKTVVDHIAEELRKKPCCVVFLENVHFADPMVQRSLSLAIRNGRFSDSHGREVMTNNKIFILASRHTKNNLHEERCAATKYSPLQILVQDTRNHMSKQHSTQNRTLENIPCQIFLNKRKLNGKDEIVEQNVNVSLVKRPNKRLNMSLDLNLPAGVTEDDTANSTDTDSWLDSLSDQGGKALVKVVFDPFDYDALAEKVLKWVNESFNKVVGLGCSLEIEPTAMDQILAAACLSEGDKDVEDWVNRVLCKGFAEAQKRYQLTADTTVILATCGTVCAEEQTLKGCLPLKIILT